MNARSGNPTTFQEWRLHHYQIEKEYARRILETPKGSDERRRVFRQAYSDVIGNIIEQYNPGGGETSYTDMVVGIVKVLHKVLRKPKPSVLDLGCGSGHLVVGLAKAGYDVYGIDVSEASVAEAKRDLAAFGKSDRVMHADILDYNAPAKFDIIVMDNVIEHLVPDETSDILAKCYEMLAQDGYLVVLTPHSFSGPHDISRYFVPFGSKAQGFHLKEFTFTEMDECLKVSGFDDVWAFPFHPQLLSKYHLMSKPSKWAARKSMILERIAQSGPFPRLLRMGRTPARILTAVACPAVAVGVKRAART
jgi:2-polyprenyl-3-methyl-5-hydroxy-6-metoxy-1,4-benzoquinol methylase